MRQRLLASVAFALCACASTRPKGGLEPLSEVSLAAVDHGFSGRRLALVVGVNHFQDTRWPALKYAAADARDLGQALQGRGNFDSVDVLAQETVTRAMVLQALDRLAAQNTSSADTIVVYFSTHGTLARVSGGALGRYLVLSDSDEDRISETALRIDDLLERFQGLPSERKALFLASCHSGTGKSALPGDIRAELSGIKGAFFPQPLHEISQATLVLAACGWGQTAREDDALGHDIYTNFLLEALSGEDPDGDGAITATEAHSYALARTYYYSGGRQRPELESRLQGSDPIVLSGRRERVADPVLFSFLPRFHGLGVQVDGRDKGNLPARLVLPPGRHRILLTEAGGEVLLDTEVELAAGQSLALETLLSAEVEHAARESAASEALLETLPPPWAIEARAGYQQFLDASVRNELIAPLGLMSLVFTRHRFPAAFLETSVELSVGGGGQQIEVGSVTRDQDLLQIAYGLELLARLDLGAFALLLGPRLSVVHVLRLGFNTDGTDQALSNFSPGLVGQVRLALGRNLHLGVEARLQYLPIFTLSDPVHALSLDLLGGLGWSF